LTRNEFPADFLKSLHIFLFSDKLLQYLELCKNCLLLQSVGQQCDSWESTQAAQVGEDNSFIYWNGPLNWDSKH